MAPKRKSADMGSSQSNTKKSSKPDSKPKKLSSQQHTKVSGFVVPQTVQTLNRLSDVAGITSINDLPQDCLGSGSDVTEKQLLAMRIIFAPELRFKFINQSAFWNSWNLNMLWNEATDLVDKDPEFKAYLRLLSTGTSIGTVRKSSPDWPGSLNPVKLFHEQILGGENRSPDQSETTSRNWRSSLRPRKSIKTDVDSGLEAKIMRGWEKIRGRKSSELHHPAAQQNEDDLESSDDHDTSPEVEERPSSHDSDKTFVDPNEYSVVVNEPTPNASLIILLQATCDLVFGHSLAWTLNPVRFRSQFRLGRFNAYTDGALRSTVDRSVLSIVEVKREMRDMNMKETQMQEGAEMASWILSDQENTRSQIFKNYRLLLSQNRHMISVTVGTSSPEHLDYLVDAEGAGQMGNKPFLSMQRFGPLDVRNPEQMRQLAVFMTAVTLFFESKMQRSI